MRRQARRLSAAGVTSAPSICGGRVGTFGEVPRGLARMPMVGYTTDRCVAPASVQTPGGT